MLPNSSYFMERFSIHFFFFSRHRIAAALFLSRNFFLFSAGSSLSDEFRLFLSSLTGLLADMLSSSHSPSVLLVPLKLRDLVISAMRSAVLALEVLLLPGRAAVLLEANTCFSFILARDC